MSDTVFVSTHRLPVAGGLREAFRDEGFRVELVSEPEDLSGEGRRGAADDAEPALVVLTGLDDGEGWAAAAHEGIRAPLFVVVSTAGDHERAERLGAEEIFGPVDPAPADVALVGRRTVERRRLQDRIGIVGESEPMRELLERVVQIAPVDSTVLITGESGTGKELVARGIHHLSPRRHRAFMAVNVAALSDTLLESELFGHEKGAFTGAIDRRKGFFELAHRGTLFLDEIGEMPLALQTKMLRVLEQREFMRVGGESSIEVDVRVIVATNRDLREMVGEGSFRRDLYYRLNILDLHLPPLRERPEDLPVLVRHFIREISEQMDRPFPGISTEAMRILHRHSWPGNVRELRNLIESMVVLAPGREIGPDDIPDEIRARGAGTALTRHLGALPQHIGRERDEDAGSGSDDERSVSPAVPDESAPRRIQPELEFVFRTLMDMRVDMEELRREFEAYRSEMDDRLDEERPVSIGGGPGQGLSRGIEIGTLGGDDLGPSAVGTAGAPDEPDEMPSQTIVFKPGMTIDEMEAKAIEAVLDEVDGNRRKAAESLGIGERTLYRKIRRYGIDG